MWVDFNGKLFHKLLPYRPICIEIAYQSICTEISMQKSMNNCYHIDRYALKLHIDRNALKFQWNKAWIIATTSTDVTLTFCVGLIGWCIPQQLVQGRHAARLAHWLIMTRHPNKADHDINRKVRTVPLLPVYLIASRQQSWRTASHSSFFAWEFLWISKIENWHWKIPACMEISMRIGRYAIYFIKNANYAHFNMHWNSHAK